MMFSRFEGVAAMVTLLCLSSVRGSPLPQDEPAVVSTDEKTAPLTADEANPPTDEGEVQETTIGPHDEGDLVKEELNFGAETIIEKTAAKVENNDDNANGKKLEKIIPNDRYAEQQILARFPRSLTQEEELKLSGLDRSSFEGINLYRRKRSSGNPKWKSEGATGRNRELVSGEPTEQEKPSCDEQKNWTPKKQGRARRPRYLTAEKTETSQRCKRDAGATDASTGKVPKNRPTKPQKSTNGTQSGEVKKPQGRARRPRSVAEAGLEITKDEVDRSQESGIPHRSKRVSGVLKQKWEKATETGTGQVSSDGQTEQKEQSSDGQKNKPQKQGCAWQPRDLPAQECKTLSKAERGNGTQKQNSGNAMEAGTGQELSNIQTKLEKQSSNGQKNWTLKKQARARRPRDLTTEESKASRKRRREAAATDSSTKKVPKNRPSKPQKPTKAKKPQGRARRPRDFPEDEESEKEEDETEPLTESSVTNEPTDSPDTESGPRTAERSLDEPAVAGLQSTGTEAAEGQANHAEDPSSPGEDKETTTEFLETELAAEPDSSLQSEGSVGAKDSGDRRPRHDSLREENYTEGRGKFDGLPSSVVDDSVTSAALSRPKRQQMGFLHYRKPNPAAFNGKPYTGRPWPEVSRRANQGRPLP